MFFSSSARSTSQHRHSFPPEQQVTSLWSLTAHTWSPPRFKLQGNVMYMVSQETCHHLFTNGYNAPRGHSFLPPLLGLMMITRKCIPGKALCPLCCKACMSYEQPGGPAQWSRLVLNYVWMMSFPSYTIPSMVGSHYYRALFLGQKIASHPNTWLWSQKL